MALYEEDEDTMGGMILVMGLTGSGKSYFINKLKQGAVIESSHIFSETSKCELIDTVIGGSSVAIVDTPGFDDSFRSDEEIFREIANFLGCQYKLGIPLKGIIYLHRITDNRMQGSARRALSMFRSLCGEDALDHVLLATTMWSNLRQAGEGHMQEQRLRTGVWTEMEQRGSTIVPYDGSKDSAVALVASMLSNSSVTLQIQRELIDEEMSYAETAAAATLVKDLDSRLIRRHEAIARLNARAQRSGYEQSDPDTDDLQIEQAEKEDEVRRKQLLQKKAVDELDTAALKEARKTKWRNRLQTFAAVLGVTVSIVVNVVLPLVGVPMTV